MPKSQQQITQAESTSLQATDSRLFVERKTYGVSKGLELFNTTW